MSVVVFYTQQTQFRVLKNFSVRLSLIKQVIPNGDYAVHNRTLFICLEKIKDLGCPSNVTITKANNQKQHNILKNFPLLTELTRITEHTTVMKGFGSPIWQKTKNATESVLFYDGKFIRCDKRIDENLYIGHINLIMIPPFCAVGLSIICLLLLLIVYGMLSELRTLPGLNLISLSFAFLLWLTYYVFLLLLYIRVGEVFEIPCAQLGIGVRFTMNCIFTNAAVNIYHLRKTFCRNTPVKSDVNKWKTFLKYCLFSWGVPVVLAVVYIVLVSKDVLKFHQSRTEPNCVDGHDIPGWLALMEEFGLPCSLLLYIIIMFIITSYRIHKKLKASRTIAQKSNIVRKRHSFVLLLKLSTTTAISWIPLLIERTAFDLHVKVTVWTVMLLSGVYVGVAFIFTRKNYQLLKKKYFPGKKKPLNEMRQGKIGN